MRRRIDRLAGRLRVYLYGTSRWWSLFGIGILLGATIVFTKLALLEIASSQEGVQQAAAGLVIGADSLVTGKEGDTAVPSNERVEQTGIDKVRTPALPQKPNKQTGSSIKNGTIADSGALDEQLVRVYLTKDKRIETVPLEVYVQGVLAGEMPIEFELEALKAQAIAARTYIIRRIALKDASDISAAQGDVTDTIAHQVYIPIVKLEQKWSGEAKKANLTKLKRAVAETKGLIITYENEPIQASFFSTSNGYTENSEDYWGQKLPYLRSVTSPWDAEISPRYKETIELTKQEFYSKMGFSESYATAKPAIKVIDRTEGKRIKSIKINGKSFSGREVRERLNLASSQFTWKIKKNDIIITTYGFGHGVGMSQWGANGMAQEGHKAVDIVRYYYSGTKVEQASKILNEKNS